jgi:hypothetical protein
MAIHYSIFQDHCSLPGYPFDVIHVSFATKDDYLKFQVLSHYYDCFCIYHELITKGAGYCSIKISFPIINKLARQNKVIIYQWLMDNAAQLPRLSADNLDAAQHIERKEFYSQFYRQLEALRAEMAAFERTIKPKP